MRVLFCTEVGWYREKISSQQLLAVGFLYSEVIFIKIAIYGGSFDPPHIGHRRLSENLSKLVCADKTLIVPAHSSPFKNGCNASDADRLNMCRAAFSGDGFEVCDIELLRGGKSYTYDTVCELKKRYPEGEFFLFMGDDMFLSLGKWYKSAELLGLVKPVAACRTDDRREFSKMRDYAEGVLKLKEGEYFLSYEKPFEISSTAIREMIKNGERAEDFLDKDVYNYIKEGKLYL